MRNFKSKSSRKGFTLIEVILAIVVVAVIMGIAIPKVMSNSDKAQIKQSISSDVRSIVEAAADWKRTDRATSDGTYKNISESQLSSRLPSNMDVNGSGILSSGFNGGCIYNIEKDSTTTSKFMMAIDCATASNNLSWSSKLKQYAEQAFVDSTLSLSKDANVSTSDTINNITCDADSSSGIACVNSITQ